MKTSDDFFSYLDRGMRASNRSERRRNEQDEKRRFTKEQRLKRNQEKLARELRSKWGAPVIAMGSHDYDRLRDEYSEAFLEQGMIDLELLQQLKKRKECQQ